MRHPTCRATTSIRQVFAIFVVFKGKPVKTSRTKLEIFFTCHQKRAEEDNFTPILPVKSGLQPPVNRNARPNLLRLPVGCVVHLLGGVTRLGPLPIHRMRCSTCIGLLSSFYEMCYSHLLCVLPKYVFNVICDH